MARTSTGQTADEIATLFARGRRDGAWNLTVRQVAWLVGVAQREADRQGCQTEQRHFDGFLVDSKGESTGVFWSLDIYRNRAGLFKVRDERRRQAEEDAIRESAAYVPTEAIEETLRNMDAEVDRHPDLLRIRNMFAEVNGLPERTA